MSLIVSWHPTYAFFHNPYEWGAFKGDLDRFARMLKGQLSAGPKFILTGKKVTAKRIKMMHRYALVHDVPISCDIETAPEGDDCPWTGKDPTRAALHLVGLGISSGGLSIDWRRAHPSVKRAAKNLLEDPEVQIDGQNFDWFDYRVLERYGVKVTNIFDTRDARRALSATSPLNLGYLASVYTDPHPWKEKEDGEEKGALFQKPEYNAYDCFYTSAVAAGIRAEPEWKSERVQHLYATHRNLSRIAAGMHSRGLYVNPVSRAFAAWALEEEFKEKNEKLKQVVGIDGFECNPNHLRALIFKKHATKQYERFARFNLPDPIDPEMYSDPKLMDTISVNEDTLTLLLVDPGIPDELRAIIDLYWDAASTRKARSTFITSELVEHAIGRDSRLRAGWNSCGTDTGRFSCSEPNVMNVPQNLRMYVEAPPGMVMVGADYSQLELRVRAAVMQDRVLMKHLAAGDVYSMNAKEWFNLPADMDVKKMKPGARKSSKSTHLACQYAAGLKTVYRNVLKEDRKAKFELISALFNQFRRTYSDTATWWQEEHQRVCRMGFSEDRIDGRRRYYPREPPPTETANFPIQSTAGAIANRTIIELDRKLTKYVPGSELVVQLHDAFYVYTPRARVAETVEILRDCMETPQTIDGQRYIFPTEIKVADPEEGKNWSDL